MGKSEQKNISIEKAIDRELELDLKRSIFSGSYYEYFRWAFVVLFPNERYEDTFHIRYLCDLYQVEIERIIKKEERTTDLIVNIPPRTSKSLITSVVLLSWVWIKEPSLPMIAVSFDEDLSLLNAQYSKDLIKSPEYQELFGHLYQIRSDVDSKGYFMNDKGGFRLSKTTGSNITGHKGVIIIVDDPQNPKTSESVINRKATIDYYTRALYNRLTPINLGIRIIIMQRLHENDLTGYLLENDPDSYRHICLPAVSSDMVKPKQLQLNYRDGLLDPTRLSAHILAGFRKTLGLRGYTGQYEQRPSPDEGGIIKRTWFDVLLPEMLIRKVDQSPIHFFIDSAYTAKTENDPTGILACFEQDNFLYVLDFKEEWLEFPQLCNFIIHYTDGYQYSTQSKIFIEPKASGKSIVQQLRASTRLNVIEAPNPEKDKITRAHGITPTLESRRVRLIQGPYVEHFLELLGSFPNGNHDEAVDTLVMAVNELLINNNPDFLFV